MEAAPQASISFDADADQITHNGGDDIAKNEYHVVVQGEGTFNPPALSPGVTEDVGSSSLSGTARIIHNSTGNVIAKGEL